jgi:hypothetical protein
VSGEAAVSKAVEQNSLAGADMAAPAPMATAQPGGSGGGPADDAAAQRGGAAVTTVGSKAFVLRDGVWTDTTFDPTTMTTTQLTFGGDDFFALLAQQPELGQYFALGEQVIVVANGIAYETISQ